MHDMDCENLPTRFARFILLSTILSINFYPIACQHEDESGSIPTLNDTLFPPEIYTTDDNEYRCMQMRIPLCENVQYNKTMLPNRFGHITQDDVIININMFHPLIAADCSPDLKLFLCTVYAPICFDHTTGTKPLILSPCRSLCESALQGCSVHLVKYKWPEKLRCENFPDKRQDRNCVGRDEDANRFQPNSLDLSERSDGFSSVITRDLGFVCPKNFEVNSYKLHLNGKTYNNCAMPCEDVLLDKNSAQIVRLATGLLAVLCILLTSFTCLTFLINTKRFEYPFRPITIIAFCQLIVGICYLIGFLTNNKVACNDPAEPPKTLPNLRMIRTTTMGNKKGTCTLQFMALYFFQISAMFWWLMMTVSWYMIAKLKWAPEAVSSVSKYFHLVSWPIPALLTIYLSVLGNIEGDSLTGTCYVSFSDQESTRYFVIYPIAICLATGCFFLSLGLKSIWDHREALRREYGKQTDEHYKLVIRIGLFSFLFITFAAILIFCHYHEQSNLNTWMYSWLSNICKNRDYSIPCPVRNYNHDTPHYWMFILKYSATMAVGIVSAIFMMSEKTLTAYKKVGEFCNFRI